jgi:EAL domain-containing protein (putative c-di-GMP-specific phosphodiesterase class I)
VGRPSRVLLLEGDAASSATIIDAALDVGMETRLERSFEALEGAIASWRPTHLVIDLSLTDVDGIEVVHRLADLGYAGTVVVTGALDRRVLEAVRRSGRSHGLSVSSLTLPVDGQHLREVLADHGDTAALGTEGAGRDDAPSGAVPSAEDFARALELRDLRVVYQPKVDCRTGVVVALEGLARWHDARCGDVPAGTFVTLAEEHGLIHRLTESVFREALTWFGEHFSASTLVLCLNVSARSLDDLGFADHVEALCAEASVDPSRLVIEVTETSSVRDQIVAGDVLTRFRIKGMSVALDDFGSGHSSLVQLARQPFSELKIDRAFVSTAAHSDDSRNIVRAIVGLGRSLDMGVTAEGIETAQSLEAIAEIGCDVMQGNYIAPPMEADEVLEWIDSRYPLLRAATGRHAP